MQFEGSPPQPRQHVLKKALQPPVLAGSSRCLQKVPKRHPLEPAKIGACRGSFPKKSENLTPHPLEPAKTGACRAQKKTDFSVFQKHRKKRLFWRRHSGALCIYSKKSVSALKNRKNIKKTTFLRKSRKIQWFFQTHLLEPLVSGACRGKKH